MGGSLSLLLCHVFTGRGLLSRGEEGGPGPSGASGSRPCRLVRWEEKARPAGRQPHLPVYLVPSSRTGVSAHGASWALVHRPTRAARRQPRGHTQPLRSVSLPSLGPLHLQDQVQR